jgi:hypothetical protein
VDEDGVDCKLGINKEPIVMVDAVLLTADVKLFF